MEDPIAWWTAFGALAQAAGALATFAAVVVSLRLARAESGLHGSGEVRIVMEFGPSAEDLPYHLSFELKNTGLRPLHWESVVWRIGWLKRGPAKLRYRWALQSDAQASPFVSQIVQPALTGRHLVPLALVQGFIQSGHLESGFFGGVVKGLGHPPIAAFAHVSGRGPVRLKVSREVAAFLRTGDHATHFLGN